ncbi:hypothetical protein FB45DRAFT_1027435 [Roridomyces roridus]|uniref:Uncharacterized protein n=1 Tax=Roridomyces roridus TaxID=1738132 RepID=A0AAD7BU32_9AGAR|nr:hypothetical protein FB45DRAFT_1027435 [Roridomyces roridus]
MNDYYPREFHTSRVSAEITWFGHPGDSPHDIRARKMIRPTVRWTYACGGVHDGVIPDDEDESKPDGDDGGVQGGEAGFGEQSNLDSGEHEDVTPAQTKWLMWSRLLRLECMDRCRRRGAKVTMLQRELVEDFGITDSSGKKQLLPVHRLPTTNQLKSLIPPARHRERLDRNPFRATWLMVQRNPEDLYKCVLHSI